METNFTPTQDLAQQAKLALQRLFYHYNTTVTHSHVQPKNNNWNYLKFAMNQNQVQAAEHKSSKGF